ncbi:response regulator [Limoniibacter endophyticus]|uniref:Response regulator n=1 Tax=Limoniibacter endophyticus TaxID=1565040 RepID=A0A8J3DJ96_9HYPH|nr:response regulator [Limoniibacter endophyticus]GHC72793.1 response regulator [Limoniibacter endophyticus]
MTHKILVVEDEIFVAMEIEYVVSELGCNSIGIATDASSADALAEGAQIALVDLNLRDGPTGPDIGRRLAENGVTVLFMTANPAQLGNGVPGTIGVLPKPVGERELREAVAYAVAFHDNKPAMAPARLQLFN